MQYKLIQVQHSLTLPKSHRYDFDEVVNQHDGDGWKPLWEHSRRPIPQLQKNLYTSL